MDPWWNPAVEEQAIDRAHRIGRKKPVFIYRFIAKGTSRESPITSKEKKIFQDILENNGKRNKVLDYFTSLEKLIELETY